MAERRLSRARRGVVGVPRQSTNGGLVGGQSRDPLWFPAGSAISDCLNAPSPVTSRLGHVWVPKKDLRLSRHGLRCLWCLFSKCPDAFLRRLQSLARHSSISLGEGGTNTFSDCGKTFQTAGPGAQGISTASRGKARDFYLPALHVTRSSKEEASTALPVGLFVTESPAATSCASSHVAL